MPNPVLTQLEELSFSKQLAFAYLTCERLYPNYAYFADNYHFGNKTVLREAIDYIYNNLLVYAPDKIVVEDLISQVDAATPKPEEFDTILASSALDACGAIHETLHFLTDKTLTRLDSISTFATDTVDMYIQELEDLNFNSDIEFQQKIDNHPIMKRELSIQGGIITYLSKIDTLGPQDISTLIELQGIHGSLSLK
jgi:uncharacterized protein YjaG (DUF416 family)